MIALLSYIFLKHLKPKAAPNKCFTKRHFKKGYNMRVYILDMFKIWVELQSPFKIDNIIPAPLFMRQGGFSHHCDPKDL